MLNESNSSAGILIVRAFTANEAIPIKDATVFVYENDRANGRTGVIRSGTTGESGLTPAFELSAPPSDTSLRPGGEKPYTSYNIEIARDGYYTVRDVNVPIFAGITAIQPVAMIPLSEFSSPDSPENNGSNTIEILESEVL